ncbi:uncharacterized protein FQA47_021410 [Oryzias melastigma]|uniref:Uncharacterized protein n=1 Tax=Oryzias melastigma TaxID=30732 RepID=A0A834FGL2_ORYME|nr:uncharacterized protein C8orf74 homolog [Oryzias melastigma]KAF6733367.1 uncharacterized protein FQA47_021410 [Oryzias melastigma]
MEALTNIEMEAIVKLERDAGVRRLSSHFLWSEFGDERQNFHQEFVYDATMLAVNSGFTSANVIQCAAFARDIYPQLEDLDLNQFLTLLRGALTGRLRTLTPVQQHKFVQYFTDLWVEKRKLFKAVVGGATTQTVRRLHLEVELPPELCPLAQGRELQTETELQLLEKEEELKSLQEQQDKKAAQK